MIIYDDVICAVPIIGQEIELTKNDIARMLISEVFVLVTSRGNPELGVCSCNSTLIISKYFPDS